MKTATNNRENQFSLYDFSRIWQKNSLVSLEQMNRNSNEFVLHRTIKAPAKILFLIFSEDTSKRTLLKDILYYLDQENQDTMVFVMCSGDSPEKDLKIIKNALDLILSAPDLREIPVILAGEGLQGQIIAKAGLDAQNSRINMIALLNSDLSSSVPELSIVDSLKKAVSTQKIYLYRTPLLNNASFPEHLNVRCLTPSFPNEEWFLFLERILK